MRGIRSPVVLKHTQTEIRILINTNLGLASGIDREVFAKINILAFV
jgi:hypothetical protein